MNIELRIDCDVPLSTGQSAQITEEVDHGFQPKRLVIEGNVKQWHVWGVIINSGSLHKVDLPGDFFSEEAAGILDMHPVNIPPVKKGDKVHIIVDYIGAADRRGVFRSKLIGSKLIEAPPS